MTDLAKLDELQRRFNGPIPSHLLASEGEQERRTASLINWFKRALGEQEAQEDKLVNEIDRLTLKDMEGRLTPLEVKLLENRWARLGATRRNIESYYRSLNRLTDTGGVHKMAAE